MGRKTHVRVFVSLMAAGLMAVGCGIAASRTKAVKTKSMSNLKQIYMALQMFAAENMAYPATLDKLVPDQLDEGVLESPTRPGTKGYGYVSGLKPDGTINIIAFEKKGTFEGGRNVLASDGNVAWMLEEKFVEGLQRTKDSCKAEAVEVKVIE